MRYLTSATPAPAVTAPAAPAMIDAPAGRQLAADIRPMYGLDDLVAALVQRAAGGAASRKALIFCNSRNEVEQVAAYLRQHLPYAAAIFVHYSNLDPALRREVEDGFAAAAVALCVCTSTLELGIDIGSIDDVVLVGAPPTLSAFWQRVGRGGRRRAVTRALCLARSALELLQFQALVDLADQGDAAMRHLRTYAPAYGFRPSVLVQQTFSLLKQSPTGGVRLADLRGLAPAEVRADDLRDLVGELVATRYLQAGRPGEWRAGPALNDLVDAHEIYSNIGGEARRVLIVDAFSGRTVAQTGRIRLVGETLIMGGRALKVVWRDGYRIAVEPNKWVAVEEELRVRSGSFAVPLDVSQMVRAHLKLPPGQLCLVSDPAGVWLFHFWGDLYGELLAALLQDYFQRGDAQESVFQSCNESALVSPHNAHCLRLPGALTALPPWPASGIQRHLQPLLPRLETTLELGRFHALLPPTLAEHTVIACCDLPRFENLYRAASLVTPPAGLRTRLLTLVT